MQQLYRSLRLKISNAGVIQMRLFPLRVLARVELLLVLLLRARACHHTHYDSRSFTLSVIQALGGFHEV